MSRRERYKRRRSYHPVRRIGMMAALVCVCGVAIGALVAVGWVVSVANSAPDLSQLSPQNPHTLTAIYAADGSLMGYVHSTSLYTPVAANLIPQQLKDATVAIEDRRFFQHGALDYQGILRAGIDDVIHGDTSQQGASTLTMQLVDNMYLPHTKYSLVHNLKYKITQAKLAEQLAAHHSKEWILDSYLGHVPYGNFDGEEALGVGAASEMLFNKPVWTLDLAQEALLAGLPQAPTTFNPFIKPDLALQRRQEVLHAMVVAHYITQQQAEITQREPLGLQQGTQYTAPPSMPYEFNYVVQQLDQTFCPDTPDNCPEVADGGLKVYTTIDPAVQQMIHNTLDANEGGSVLDAQPAAALAAVDPANGHVLGFGSTATYQQTAYDYPVQAHRQTGSAFKVFALMTLIHDYDGDPNQTYYVSKFLPPGWYPLDPTWQVHTAEESYQGTINVTKATVVSDNTVFAQLAADIGPAKMDAMAHAMGITSPLNDLAAEVLGGLKTGVTPLEMADAYATVANGGWHVAPTVLTKVVFPDGSVKSFSNPPRQQVFSYGEAYAAIKVLKGVITSGTGTAANIGCPAAGKTGTANNLDNAWFVGFTPRVSTAVWVGYPQGNIGMPNGFGGTLAAPIWNQFMRQYNAQYENGFCGDWPAPANPWQGVAFQGAHTVDKGFNAGNVNGPNGQNGQGGVNGIPGLTATGQGGFTYGGGGGITYGGGGGITYGGGGATNGGPAVNTPTPQTPAPANPTAPSSPPAAQQPTSTGHGGSPGGGGGGGGGHGGKK